MIGKFFAPTIMSAGLNSNTTNMKIQDTVDLELESKIDCLKNLYIDWFIERLALDHYYATGKKQLPPDSKFNFYHFVEWTYTVSD